MNFARRSLLAASFALGAALSLPVLAQTAGKDYTAVTPVQATDDPGKIEVIEFFSYGCPHCSDFNPLVSAWAAKLPGDVVFKRVPITFGRAAWMGVAKLYYTLEVTGDLARLDGEVFKAIHGEGINLFDDKALTGWVAKKGVDMKKFNDAFASFGVMSKAKRGDQLAQAYKITGVPAIAVDGKYLVGDMSFTDKLAVTDKLIAKARAEKSGKK
ncbi:MAG: thiol:disulfide interchange protein DsbA/DsbL [Bacteroidota bacterium]